MAYKIVQLKRKNKIYSVCIIFLCIIASDILLKLYIHATSLVNSFIRESKCHAPNENIIRFSVRDLPEVKEFEQDSVESGNVFSVNVSTIGNTWNAEVTSTKDDKQVSFNSYTFDRCGVKRCSKKMYFKGKFIRDAGKNDFPCNSLYDTTQKN